MTSYADGWGEQEPFPWQSSPDPEEQALLRHHVSRLPPRYRIHLDLMLEGTSTSEAGRLLGISQPSAWLARQSATKRLAWLVRNVPDLTPSQVEGVLLRPVEGLEKVPEKVVQMVVAYWREWRTTGHPWPQPAMSTLLFRLGTGWAYRLQDMGVGHAVIGVGLLSIRDRPRFDRRRITPIAGQEKIG